MAQMETSMSSTRKAPVVDLTPMVDLAFLLIAFFMLATTLQKNNAMVLHMPMDTDKPASINPDRVLTLIVDAENTIWYYTADAIDAIEKTDLSTHGLREIVYQNNTRVHSQFGADKGLVCLIKLGDKANYKNMVDVLDEMEICDVATYAIQDMNVAETDFLTNNKNK